MKRRFRSNCTGKKRTHRHDCPRKECPYQRVFYAVKALLENETLDDAACFAKIEATVSLYEQVGEPCRYRHDFG